MDLIGLTDAKALGGAFVAINNALEELNFNPNLVYSSSGFMSNKMWSAGPQILDAIGAIQGRLHAMEPSGLMATFAKGSSVD